MRTRDELKSAILFQARVEMHAQGDQLFQQSGWRLDEQAVLLFRPSAQVRMVDACRNWNTQILMNGHEPVAIDRFLEVRALDRHEIGRDERSNIGMLAQTSG